MPAPKDTRSCPNCRETFPRLLEHIRFCAKDKTPEEHNCMNIDEVERGKRIAMRSVDILYLKAQYPDSCWDIAEFMIKNDFPVFERTEERTTMRGKSRKVRHMTLDEIPRRSDIQFHEGRMRTRRETYTPVSDHEDQFVWEKDMSGSVVSSIGRQHEAGTTRMQQEEGGGTIGAPVARGIENSSPNYPCGHSQETEGMQEHICTLNFPRSNSTPPTKRKRMSQYCWAD